MSLGIGLDAYAKQVGDGFGDSSMSELQDLQKAAWYLNREIARRQLAEEVSRGK